MCFVLFTSLLDSKRGVLYCLRHFYIAREVFCIVYVTFIQQGRCFVLFTSLFDSQRGVFFNLRHFLKASEVFLTVYVTFIQQGRCFTLCTSLLDRQRGVFNRLRDCYKASDVFFICPRHFYIAREVFYFVYVTFRQLERCFVSFAYLSLKRASFSGLFASLLYRKGGVLYCLRHFQIAREVFLIVCVTFIKRATCFELFKTLLYSKGGFYFVYVTFRQPERCF